MALITDSVIGFPLLPMIDGQQCCSDVVKAGFCYWLFLHSSGLKMRLFPTYLPYLLAATALCFNLPSRLRFVISSMLTPKHPQVFNSLKLKN
jgi:hypothetical protein